MEERAEGGSDPDGGGNATKCKLLDVARLLHSRIHTTGVPSIRPAQDQATHNTGIDGGGALQTLPLLGHYQQLISAHGGRMVPAVVFS